MPEEGAKAVYTETETDALIAAEVVARNAAIAVEAAARAAAIATHAANYGLHTKLVRKAADQTVNNSETLVNDAELKFAVAANEVWQFVLMTIVDTSEAADWKFTFSVPSGGHLYGWMNVMGSDESAYSVPWVEGYVYDIMGGGENKMYAMVRGIVVNGSTAGNLQLRWAQFAAEESDTIVRKNSCILAWKLA